MLSPFFGEFIGTAVLILMGEGVVAGVVLKGTKSENAGWISITAAWGFAVFCGVITAIACGSPGAHLNPAVTVAVAMHTGQWSTVPAFVLAQILGAMTGAALNWFFWLPHWAMTEDQGLKRAVFCTSPSVRKPWLNMMQEMIATSVLLLVIECIGSKLLAVSGPAPGLAPYLVAILVWAIGLSLGGVTGYAINPARDFGPRLMHQLLPVAGKGGSDWSYAWVPIAGPILGAIVMGFAFRCLGI
ncbi:MAG: aquaporin family protein [Acidobacteria bacterium]|nr:aquaporin family protein [Acidobacteriota bacterium]